MLDPVEAATTVDAVTATFEPRGITTEDTIVFVLGCVPFVWAGVEFWRRIAVGDPFGTGSDSVFINDTSGNRTRAVRRVLGADAIFAARALRDRRRLARVGGGGRDAALQPIARSKILASRRHSRLYGRSSPLATLCRWTSSGPSANASSAPT